ncbi:MAG: hypothetical protein EA417_21975 [Gammaproteobacteria bacterium]|nr:MAG: hypothetical protein EA417_21975 [Gammaproteobacteria bacterium]
MLRNTLVALGMGIGLLSSDTEANPFLEIREEHWLEAMSISGMSSELLYGIALVESGNSFNGMRRYGPWPWTLNVNREPMFFSSRAAARRHLQEQVEENNDRIAVGIWQIYLRWNGHLVDDPLDLLDPVTNLYAAAEVLRSCGERFSGAREVLSCYHAGSVREVGLAYADRVIRLAERWGEAFVMASPPEGVRYTLAQVLGPDAERYIDTIANGEGSNIGAIAWQDTNGRIDTVAGSGTSVPSISRATRTTSHSEFLEQMENRKSEWAVRVVIVQ